MFFVEFENVRGAGETLPQAVENFENLYWDENGFIPDWTDHVIFKDGQRINVKKVISYIIE